MSATDITDNILSGSKARLVPVVADSKKEERATSVLLSTFMLVPQLAEAVLTDAGAKIGVRSDIKCYTEIVFKNKDQNRARPDGLIVITRGSNRWSALVESKIGNNDLTKEQIESYLDLAREVGANAVITISNQFATTPTHHPVSVNKTKTRTVDLFHFSWLSVLSKASIMSEAKGIDDREQSMILRELVRYLGHSYSGVSPMNSMNSEWKDVCTQVQEGAVLKKSAPEIEATAVSWQQLLRYMSLELSMATNSTVQVAISRAHAKDPVALLQSDISDLVSRSTLYGALSVPNAAGPIAICADLTRKVLSLSMRVNAPEDRSRATAAINWLTRQLKSVTESPDLLIKAIWPGKTADTQCSITEAIDEPSTLVPAKIKGIPKAFEVIRVIDLGSRFKGQKVFVESAIAAVPAFYRDAGQNLTKWVAPPPKTKTEELKEKADYDDIEPEPGITESPDGAILAGN
ncbi:hypothetical protein [Thiohalomonas denitrificans]|uniref:Stress response protein SCP2 n=1 Tax=Thiohalomonas denitrificans TaxID=415747 RepID=A0A1G5R174_9GAMM|nr:hypothetical protein [Thiohalomonas denitrificans]SCZ67696.1 hypothetical protein SAMN03097708_03181 [Thiohalomonas denitrificans]